MEEKTEYYTTTTSHTVPTVTTTTTTTHYSTSTEVEEEDHKSYVLDEKHDHVSADSNEQGNVEEYDANGNHINFVMSETEKKLIRKMDFIYVMPYVCILNFLQVNYITNKEYMHNDY